MEERESGSSQRGVEASRPPCPSTSPAVEWTSERAHPVHFSPTSHRWHRWCKPRVRTRLYEVWEGRDPWTAEGKRRSLLGSRWHDGQVGQDGERSPLPVSSGAVLAGMSRAWCPGSGSGEGTAIRVRSWTSASRKLTSGRGCGLGRVPRRKRSWNVILALRALEEKGGFR